MLIDFEDHNSNEKYIVTLIFEDKESKVTWNPNEMDFNDVKFMLLCSCESLVDSDFEVLDVQGKTIDINSLKEIKNNSVFYLRKKNQISNLLFDGRRKLYVEIDPLQHIEAQYAIKFMCLGSNLLKFTTNGYPHIRLFQLSNDLERILWYTKSKTIDESKVEIKWIRDLTLGQISENFLNRPLKMLEDYSFSIYYKKNDEMKTLDIACKDEKEFDLWVIGIKALYTYTNSKIISKNDLLSHCRCYKEQIKKGNIGSSSKFLFYKDNSGYGTENNKTLENFLSNSRELSMISFSNTFVRLCNKIESLRPDIELYSNEDVTLANNKGENNEKSFDGYQEVFGEEAIVDDLETQKSQMIKLFKNCENNLTINIYDFMKFYEMYKNKSNICFVAGEHQEDFRENMSQIRFNYDSYLPVKNVINSLDEKEELDKINDINFLKKLDMNLWKIEVDLENTGDIINRFKALGNKGTIDKLKQIFKGMNLY